MALAIELPTVAVMLAYGIDADDALTWLFNPSFSLSHLAAGILLAVLPMPLAVLLEAFASKFIGRVAPGVINRWSMSYVRVCLKTEMLQSAGEWLSGSSAASLGADAAMRNRRGRANRPAA